MTEKQEKLIAAVRIRGNVGIEPGINSTLTMLKLRNQNICVVYSSTPGILGMLKKTKDYVTWGEVNDETLKVLDKRKDGTFYRLNNPLKGHGRKGIKKPFSVGGALGYRGEKINDLIKRMCH